MATQKPKLGLPGAKVRRKRKAREFSSDKVDEDTALAPKRVRTGGSLLRPYYHSSIDPGSACLRPRCDGSHQTRDGSGGFAVVHNRLKVGTSEKQGRVGRGWPATPSPSNMFTEALALAQCHTDIAHTPGFEVQ
ncbi:hypothetical protein SMACR_09481 [Sordaria macrospora]|uniref:WGS project CABT00000000 data, contig 2.94 n=2 Tax=Sordaria macrospora TaxID=5147 RepID=F7WC33_SORMK|nr:uncharacterized protein SMAC_09481 [Sordaria macrospora k-hell]KAA8624126.1 hypothetical protein SMACR_09481 [Sordaria macrospora]KAH7635379.1 hypothetical protein B0T09DRAFT_253238 [Sordaria sp. MPI-SDFR-AT-0083]WPJ67319.1 hypothetical protein SMAC4_09481 [Sordaria macrospora]CCC05536.1 unnamed protein product [Sordaria macrospora k-hell]